MCGAIFTPKIPSPPPAPEPIPAVDNNPTIANAVTKQKAPNIANQEGYVARKRVGRGTLRIPLLTSGLTASGLNIPTS